MIHGREDNLNMMTIISSGPNRRGRVTLSHALARNTSLRFSVLRSWHRSGWLLLAYCVEELAFGCARQRLRGAWLSHGRSAWSVRGPPRTFIQVSALRFPPSRRAISPFFVSFGRPRPSGTRLAHHLGPAVAADRASRCV